MQRICTTHPQFEDVHAPFRRYSDKYAEIFENITQTPPIRAIAWSVHNLIAFSTLDAIYRRKKHDESDKSDGNYSVHILHANYPNEYVTLKTSHQSPIRFLEWCPATFGHLFLSADGYQKICLWRMQKNVNRWTCIKSFDAELIIGISWLQTRNVQIQNSDFSHSYMQNFSSLEQSYSSLEQKFVRTSSGIRMPIGLLSFVYVSANGIVTLCHCKAVSEDFWSSVSTKLHLSSSVTFSRAEIVISDGQIFLFASPSVGNTIYIYKLSIDLFSPSINAHVQCKLTVAPPSTMEFQTSLSILQLKCHPFEHKLLYTIIVDKSTGQSKLDKWEPRVESKIGVFAELLTLNASESVWHESLSEILDTNFDKFVTSMEISGGGLMIISYSDGTIEVRNGETLQVLTSDSIIQCQISETTKKRAHEDVDGDSDTIMADFLHEEHEENKITVLPTVPSIPMSFCFSANQTCICVLDYSLQLQFFRLFHWKPQTYSLDYPEDVTEFANLLQTTFLNGYTTWDLLILLQSMHDPSLNGLEFFFHVIIQLQEDFNSLDPKSRNFYSRDYERLKASIYQVIPGQQVNYVDCQIKLTMWYIRDFFESSLSKPESSNTLKALIQQLTPSDANEKLINRIPGDVEIDAQKASLLLPQGHWIIEACIFFVKNLSHFINNSSFQEESGILFNLPPDTNILAYYAIYSSYHRSGTPMISLLFDPPSLDILQELLVYHLVLQKSVGSSLSHETLTLLRLISIIRTFCYKVLQALPPTAENMNRILREASSSLNKEINQMTIASFPQQMNSLILSLDVFPPALGFLQNQQGIKKNPLVNLQSKTDVVTRKILERKPKFRQCTGCNRLTMLAEINQGETSLVNTWNLACPMCGNLWKLFEI